MRFNLSRKDLSGSTSPARHPARRAFGVSASLLALGLALGAAGLAHAQQGWPSKPVKIIVPYPPGGSVDPVARMVATKLTEMWGQQVVVDNKPGASTIIGTDALAKSAPDGYTFMITASTHVSNPLLFKSLPYDSFKDFEPVGPLYKAAFVLVVHPSTQVNTLQEFITLTKSKPGQLSYGSAGNGNANHMAGELFGMMTGTQMLHVPYKGGGPLLTDLLAGQTQVHFAVPLNVIPHIQAGRLKALATTSEARLPLMPGVPTFAEAGLPGFGMKSWLGVLAPAGTPKPIVARVSADLARVLSMPDVSERLQSNGQTPYILNPEQFAKVMREDMAEFDKVIKAANIKVD